MEKLELEALKSNLVNKVMNDFVNSGLGPVQNLIVLGILARGIQETVKKMPCEGAEAKAIQAKLIAGLTDDNIIEVIRESFNGVNTQVIVY